MFDYTHPIIDTKFLITSNEMSRVCSIAMDRVFMRRTGVIFYGPARLGKTECCKALKECLSKYSPRAYLNWLVAVNREGQQYTNIALQLAKLEGYKKHSRDTRLDVLDFLANKLVLRVKERGCNQYVCLIDEFQRLKGTDLYQLADLYNLLDQQNIKMTVVSFAMPEVVLLREEFFCSEQHQIIARFMSELIEFKGCTGVSDLEAIFKGYDLFTEYPEGSGVSFTRAFLPKAFSVGFRLEDYTEIFWDAMNSYASGAYVRNLPMEHVLSALKYILVGFSSKDVEGLTLSELDISAAIEASSFREFCKVGGQVAKR